MIHIQSGIYWQGQVQFVEVQVAVYRRAFPQLVITGLPSAEIRESRERILAVLRTAGISLPRGRYVVHLHPGETKKRGAWLDLAIWLALVASTDVGHSVATLQKPIFAVGALSLDGKGYSPRGSLNILSAAFEKYGDSVQYVFPQDVLQQPFAWRPHRDAYSFNTVQELLFSQFWQKPLRQLPPERVSAFREKNVESLLVHPQVFSTLQRVLVGGHSALLFGSPGQGKTRVFQQAQALQPLNAAAQQRDRYLQFDAGAPHTDAVVLLSHTLSAQKVASWLQMSQQRVCVFDELPLWSKIQREQVQEWLDVPSERDFPAMGIATANPCPCGWYGEKQCQCSEYARQQYRSKLTGPLIDRFAQHVRVIGQPLQRLDQDELDAFRTRLSEARRRQRRRAQRSTWPLYASLYRWEDLSQVESVPSELKKSIAMWSIRRQLHCLQMAYTLCDWEGTSDEPNDSHWWEARAVTQPAF